jgi:hypothetical protein
LPSNDKKKQQSLTQQSASIKVNLEPSKKPHKPTRSRKKLTSLERTNHDLCIHDFNSQAQDPNQTSANLTASKPATTTSTNVALEPKIKQMSKVIANSKNSQKSEVTASSTKKKVTETK